MNVLEFKLGKRKALEEKNSTKFEQIGDNIFRKQSDLNSKQSTDSQSSKATDEFELNDLNFEFLSSKSFQEVDLEEFERQTQERQK